MVVYLSDLPQSHLQPLNFLVNCEILLVLPALLELEAGQLGLELDRLVPHLPAVQYSYWSLQKGVCLQESVRAVLSRSSRPSPAMQCLQPCSDVIKSVSSHTSGCVSYVCLT